MNNCLPNVTWYRILIAERAKYEVGQLKELLFASSIPKQPDTIEVQKLIRHHFIEFAVHYKKDNGQDAAPETVNNYIYAIHRTFKSWGFPLKLTEGSIFADE